MTFSWDMSLRVSWGSGPGLRAGCCGLDCTVLQGRPGAHLLPRQEDVRCEQLQRQVRGTPSSLRQNVSVLTRKVKAGSVMVQHVKLPSATPASCVSSGLNPGWVESASCPAPCQCNKEGSGRSSKNLCSATNVGHLDGWSYGPLALAWPSASNCCHLGK